MLDSFLVEVKPFFVPFACTIGTLVFIIILDKLMDWID